MGVIKAIMSWVRNFLISAVDIAEATTNETVIRIGVTGLSRAGKTVFITSLIHNLLAMRKFDTLPALKKMLSENEESRLVGIRILSPGTSKIPSFDYQSKLKQLASATPAWPDRTDNVSEIALEIQLERRNGVRKWMAGKRRIRLELLDYPGEWLLDIPLLSQTFAQWSEETLRRLKSPSHEEFFGPFLRYIVGLSAGAPIQEREIKEAHLLYKQALTDCRTSRGFRYLQPGQFLCPGPRGDVPFLWFFPLDFAVENPKTGSNNDLLNRRFEAYKYDIKKEFFETYFTKFDRQVLLIDVLGALHAGKAQFHDVKDTIKSIVGNISIAPNALRAVADKFSSFYQGSIENLAIVATKADHVNSSKRDHLKHLVKNLVEISIGKKLPEDKVKYYAAAAINSTIDGKYERDGQIPRPVVYGYVPGQTAPKAFDCGEVPIDLPNDNFWYDKYFELPTFSPKNIDPSGENGVSHLELDKIISDLLRDVL